MEKNKIMMIVIIVLLVFLLAGIGAVVYVVLKIPSGDNKENNGTATQEIQKRNPSEITTLNLDERLNTNLLTDIDGTAHDISINLSIGIDSSEAVLKDSTALALVLSEKQSIIRNDVLKILRNKTFEELSRPDGQALLQEEILNQIRETFKTNLVITILFIDFYIQ